MKGRGPMWVETAAAPSSLPALLDVATDEFFGVGLQHGVNVVEDVVEGRREVVVARGRRGLAGLFRRPVGR